MKLLTKKIKRSLPKLGATESIDDPIAQVKFFAPGTSWTWYATEYDSESGTMFGLVYGHEAKLGHFLLQELEDYRGQFGVKIERDMFWMPMPLSHCNDPCGRLDNPCHVPDAADVDDPDSGIENVLPVCNNCRKFNPLQRFCSHFGRPVAAPNNFNDCLAHTPHQQPRPESVKVKAESGEEVTLTVQNTIDKEEAKKYGSYLVSAWCECKESEFLCYPHDGACTCGIHKHHVHCKKCGGVSQVG